MSVCRTCLSKNNLKWIFPDMSRASLWSEKLYLITGVKIVANDGLSQVICQTCSSIIQSALTLRQQSLKADEILKKSSLDTIKKENIVKYIKNEDSTEYNISIYQKSIGNSTKNEIEKVNSNEELEIEIDENFASHKKENINYNSTEHSILTDGNAAKHNKEDIKPNSNKEHNVARLEKEEKNINLKMEFKKTRKYRKKKFDKKCPNFKFSVAIEDFESSNDEDLINTDSLDNGETRTVKIEDYESSDSLGFEDFKCEIEDPVELKYSLEMREKELMEREQRRMMSKEQDLKLMSLAVTPYDRLGPIKCRLCDKILRCVQNFKCHARTHFELENTCEECGKKFVFRSHMRYHQQRVHGRTKRLACGQCSYRAVDLQALQNHERAEHTGERPYICDVCGDSFRMRANIAQHMRKHFGVRNLQCDRCPAMFRSRSELTGHQNKVHFMMYTYLCYLCPETYKRPASVKKHLANVHGVPRSQQLPIKCVKTRRKSSYGSD